jgi:hypothetical protein
VIFFKATPVYDKQQCRRKRSLQDRAGQYNSITRRLQMSTGGKNCNEKSYIQISHATNAGSEAKSARKTTKRANKSGIDTKQTQTVNYFESTNILQLQNFWK